MGDLCLRHLKTLKQQLDDEIVSRLPVKSILPTEVITDEIVSRLPVKSILRLRSVSKPWLSRISDPSFTKLQLTRASTAFFIPIVDIQTRKLHIFSANDHGGSLTHLMEIHPIKLDLMLVEMKHLNGLVFLTNLNNYEAIVVNPSTRKMLKLDYGTYAPSKRVKYFFGFDESTNEHKILRMRCVGSTPIIEIIGLSRSNYSWRKIDASFDISPNKWSRDIRGNGARGNVCVNSVIHILLQRTVELLAFDLRTETFSIVKVPPPYNKPETDYRTSPYLVRINGCIGLVPSYCPGETKEMHICILKDYENHVWVKETIVFPESWKEFPILQDYVSTGEIIFAPRNLCNGIRAPIYNMKSRSFKLVSFTLDHPGYLTNLRVYQIKCYIESIVPLLAT